MKNTTQKLRFCVAGVLLTSIFSAGLAQAVSLESNRIYALCEIQSDSHNIGYFLENPQVLVESDGQTLQYSLDLKTVVCFEDHEVGDTYFTEEDVGPVELESSIWKSSFSTWNNLTAFKSGVNSANDPLIKSVQIQTPLTNVLSEQDRARFEKGELVQMQIHLAIRIPGHFSNMSIGRYVLTVDLKKPGTDASLALTNVPLTSKLQKMH